MAIPTLRTVTEVVTQALKHAGRTSPTTDEISAGSTHLLRQVIKDITSRGLVFPELLSHYVLGTTAGLSSYALPADIDKFQKAQVLDASTFEGYTGTAQSGTASTIRVAATLNEPTITQLRGKYIGIYEGTGINQIRQGVNWNNSTKDFSISPDWTTNPDSSSKYLIGAIHKPLDQKIYESDFLRIQSPFLLGPPTHCFLDSLNLQVYPTPDKVYLLWLTYYAHPDRIDTTSTVFRTILTIHENVFVQGIAVKGGQRWDEDRYEREYGIYQDLLGELGGNKTRIKHMRMFNA